MSITQDSIVAAQPSTSRGSGVHLSYDPRSDRIAYAANKSIHVRSVSNPEKSIQYTKHTALTTVAKFSPSGFYIASGDADGNVKIWDAAGDDMVTKGEYQVISGKIMDIDWDADSQRVIAVGDGKERYGHCFTADSGNTVGEISGHTEIVNAVSIRPVRPYRAATVSDDGSLVFYHGPPFRFNSSVKGKHTNFVHDTKFSPNGDHLVSVGADRKLALYDGKSGEFLELLDTPHEASIFAIAWSPDSKHLVTASADATVSLWSIDSKKVVHTWKLERKLENSQVGVVYAGSDRVISLSLNGDLNYLEQGSESPSRVVSGHQKSITSLVTLSENDYVSGSYDSSVIGWSSNDVGVRVGGSAAHQGMIVGIVKSNDKLWSTAWDDTLKSLSKKDGRWQFTSDVASIGAQPIGISADEKTGLVAVITEDEVLLFNDGKQLAKKKPGYLLSSVAVNGKYVIVADRSNNVHVLSSDDLSHLFDLPALRSVASILSFSPVDSKHLAAGDVVGKITLYDVDSKSIVTNRWAFHTSRVQSIDWHETGDYIVSGASDTNIIVYCVSKPARNIKFMNAHKEGTNAVSWISKDKIVSGGADATLKHWTVNF